MVGPSVSIINDHPLGPQVIYHGTVVSLINNDTKQRVESVLSLYHISHAIRTLAHSGWSSHPPRSHNSDGDRPPNDLRIIDDSDAQDLRTRTGRDARH